jgi:hypothetical protein
VVQSTTEVLSADEVETVLQAWLDDEGFSLWKLSDKQARFALKMARDEYPPLVVVQPKGRVDSVQVSGEVRFAYDAQKRIAALPEKERNFLLFDLRMVLLATECRFQFTPSPKAWSSIRLSKTVFYDGLTKDRFFEVVDVVSRALSSVILTFEWKFGITPYVS